MAITTLTTNPNSGYTLDDFDETKNYHRVLFKPGVAVQARELTQLQTALQRQIDYHGQYSFNDGSRVVGGKVSLNSEYDFVKVEDVFGTGGSTFTTSSYFADFKDKVLQGGSSQVKAKVLQVINASGTDVNDSTKTGILDTAGQADNITLYVQYVSGDGTTDSKTFLAGEVLTPTDSSLSAKKARVCGFANGDTLNSGSASSASSTEFVGSANTASSTAASSAIGKGSVINIEEGAYFIKGTFVYVKDDSLILSKYTSTPSVFVGLQVTETVVSSTADTSLNDNAAGSTNLSAPGADRYKIETKLIKTAKDSTPNSEFSDYALLATVENGIIASDKSDKNNTTELTKRLARRTFEESGNYSTSGFKYDVREYYNDESGNGGYKTSAAIIADTDAGNASAAQTFGENRLAFGIAPTTIYIDGFRIENTRTKYVTVEKPRTDTVSKDDFQMDINYGDFFLVRATGMQGMPDINNYTIATMQNENNDSKAIAHFATITGAGAANNRGQQTITLEHKGGTGSAAFQKTAADGTQTDIAHGSTGINRSGTFDSGGTSKGLKFKLIVDQAGAISVEILEGGQFYNVDNTFTIDISEVLADTASSTNLVLGGATLGLGTCRFRSLERHPDSSDNAVFRLHVFDTKITSGSLNEVGRFDQAHEDSTNGGQANNNIAAETGKAPFVAVTATTSDAGISVKQVGKLYTNYRNDTTANIFQLPFQSIKSLGSETSGGAQVPRVRFKKKFRYNKSNASDNNVDIALSDGETLFGSTSFVTEHDDDASARLTTTTGTTTANVASLADTDETDGNVILTFEKSSSESGHSNKSLRTKTISYSDTDVAPFNAYTFDGHSPIMLNKADIQKVYYMYDVSKRITLTGATSNAGAVGGTTITLNGQVTTIIPGMNIVSKASDEAASAPVGLGRVVSVSTGNPTVITVDRPLTVDPDSVTNKEFYAFNNLLTNFDVDNGQRPHFYDEGRLIPEGVQNSIANLRIKFKYYTHGPGDYFTIDSISDATEKSKYDGRFGIYRLRDCIDFRPVKSCSGDITLGKEFSTGTGGLVGQQPAEGSALFTDVISFLPRIDKVIVDREGNFSVLKGQTGEEVFPPEDKDNALTLFTIYMRGFMFGVNDYKVETHKYKRYQMKDIASIDDRVKRLEYYTSLNFLEKAAQDEIMTDTLGNQLFKNGIFVDPFQGHNKSNVNHPDHLCAIDKKGGILRPHSNTKNVPMRRYANDKAASGGTDPKGSRIVEKNSLYTLRYSNVPFIEQPYAADSIKVNPYNIFTWGGVMHLSPDSDEWIDTVHRPDIIEDQTGVYNSLLATLKEENAIGTVWNSWETTHVGVDSQLVSTSRIQLEDVRGENWRTAVTHNGVVQRFNTKQTYDYLHIDAQSLANNTGDGWRDTGWGDDRGRRMRITTETYSDTELLTQSRDGFRNDIVVDTIQESQGTKIVETQIVPFIRPRKIFFRAEHLKPNTRFYPFFDGIDVSAYCKEVSAGYGADGFVEWTKREAIESTQTLMNQTSLEGTGNLTTDSGGKLFGMFQIPNDAGGLRFKAGIREFRISDDSNNNEDNEQSYAEANYFSAGKINHLQETIKSTRVPRIETTQLNESRVIKGDTTTRIRQTIKYTDPLAQTFIVDQTGGLFTTKLDLFVKQADDTGGSVEKGSIPLRVSIREVENGIPTQRIVPGADVTVYYNSNTNGHPANALVVGDTYTIHTVGTSNWANAGWVANEVGPDGDLHDANPAVGDSFICTHTSNAGGNGIARAENTCYAGMITDDSSVACPIKWEHPIYLPEASEFAIVLIASSELWKVFFSETGRKDITPTGGTPGMILKQPYNGVFFTSQNASTWSPHQLRDLKFNLYRANFVTTDSEAQRKANFVNDAVEADKLVDNPFTYVSKPDSDTTVIRVHHPNHGMYTGNQVGSAASTNSKVVFTGFPTTDNNVAGTVINAVGGHTIHDIEHDSYCITVGASGSAVQATTTGIIGGGSSIFATSNAQFNTMHIYNENFQPAGTGLTAQFALDSNTLSLTTGKSMDGDTVGLGNQSLNYQPASSNIIPKNIPLNENRNLPFPCVIASTINETTHHAAISSEYDKKSFGLEVVFNTDNSFVSPVIDGRRFSIFATQNRISDASCYNQFAPDGVTQNKYYNNSGVLTNSGSSTQNSYYNNTSKGRFYSDNSTGVGTTDINSYITNNIVLKNNSTELRVLANVSLPPDSKVYLYYKTTESLSSDFVLSDWIYASPSNNLSVGGAYDNAEWIINPASSFTAFALKVVLLSKDSSNVPMVRNFRAIAAV